MNFNLLLTIAIFVVIAVAVETQPLFDEKCDYERRSIHLEERVKRLEERVKRLEERDKLMSSIKVCPKGWKTYEDSCYKLFGDGKTMKDGKKLCSSVGGYLVEIETSRENYFIVKELQENATRIRTRGIWIGATDENTEGQWRWITTSTKLSYVNWSFGEPNNDEGIEHCVAMRGDQSWLWNDTPCTEERSVLCEREKTEQI